MVKKLSVLLILTFVSSVSFAQNVIYQNKDYGNIDKSEFREIDSFQYDVEEKKVETGNYTAKLKMNVKFYNQRTTTVSFKDDDSWVFFDTDFRWPLEKNQEVTIYFTVEHKVLYNEAFWDNKKLILCETNENNNVRPWNNYISNGKNYLNGWYLEDLGNGLYQERFYQNGRVQNATSPSNQTQSPGPVESYSKKKTERLDISELEEYDVGDNVDTSELKNLFSESDLDEVSSDFEKLSDKEKKLLMYLMLLYLLAE